MVNWQAMVLIVAVVGAIVLSKLTGLARPATDTNFGGDTDGCDAGGDGCH